MKELKFSTKAWIVLGFAALLPALYGAQALRRAILFDRSLHPERAALTTAMKEEARAAFGAYEDVAFWTADSLEIKAWYVPPRENKLVILVHGGFANRHQMLPEAKELVKRGIGVLLYDSRASGESEGNLMSWGDQEQADLKAALDYAEAKAQGQKWKIGVQGFSIGATTAVMVTAEDQRVRALAVNAVWPSLEQEIRYKNQESGRLQAWFATLGFLFQGIEVSSTRPFHFISNVYPRPLLMVIGDRDADTPRDVFQSVYEAAKEPKKLVVVSGAGHGDYAKFGGETYLEEIGNFFDSNLKDSE